MESQVLQFSTWVNPVKIPRKPTCSMQFCHNYGEKALFQMPTSCHPLATKRRFNGPLVLSVSCSSENSPDYKRFSGGTRRSGGSLLQSKSISPSVDQLKTVKKEGNDVEPYLNGKCVFLVGMMGSGKTTVGKVLAEALGYSFCDCDTLIEEAVGGNTVAEIFKEYGETFFRDNETEVLHKLSSMHRVIVSTGGGAVVRPINWRHMQKGVSVWLDVPLDALARRLMAVGTHSRPLLHQESGDPYSKTMNRLSKLFEERGEAYGNADVRVCLESLAAKHGTLDICSLTPTDIVIEVLEQIEKYLKKPG